MPISPEKLKEIRTKAGFSPTLPARGTVDSNLGQQRVNDFYKAIGGAPVTEKGTGTKVAEAVGNFTGGTKIAQGLGQALARTDFNIPGLTSGGSTEKALETADDINMQVQNNLLSRIKEKRANGEDTTRLQAALKDLGFDLTVSAANREDMLNPEKLTGKEVIGDALQLATTATGSSLVKGTKAGTIIKNQPVIPGISALTSKIPVIGSGTGVLKGAARGFITGTATGATEGALYGTAQGLKENEDLGGVLGSARKGSLVGAATGGTLGTIAGGYSGARKAKQAADKISHLDAVTPNTKDLSPDEYQKLVRQGRISPATGTAPDKYVLSQSEIDTADKYKKLLTKDPVKNTQNLIQEIANTDKKVGTFLKKNNGIFNTGELKNNLSETLSSIDDLTVDEARLSKLKKSTVDNFIKSLKKNDMESLWKSRKEFDRSIEKSFSGSPTLQKNIKKAFRNGIQDFISQRTPNTTYKNYMKEMSNLFDLVETTSDKAIKERGINAVQKWIKKNPTKTSAIKWLGGTGLAGTIGYNLLSN